MNQSQNEDEKKSLYAHLPLYQRVQRRAEDVLKKRVYLRENNRDFPSRRERRAGRANVRYLTSRGHIVTGKDLFKLPSGVDVHSTVLCHDDRSGREPKSLSINELRRMHPAERRKFFNPSKAWRPAANV